MENKNKKTKIVKAKIVKSKGKDPGVMVMADNGSGHLQMDIMQIPPKTMPSGEFCAKDHKVSQKYYDILERGLSHSRIKKEMLALIEQDPDFYDSYIVVGGILESELKISEAKEYYARAYQRAKEYLNKNAGGLPQKMRWGYLENRHILRAFGYYAYNIWKYDNNRNEALEIFRWLLRCNPNDNQGARYDILALRTGLKWNWRDKYEAWDGNFLLGLDPRKMDAWFDEESKKFPEEFKDFWKYAKSLE